RADDLVSVACSPVPKHAFAVTAAWPGADHHWRAGVDGADLLLLEVAHWAIEIDRFDRAVVGSGDRIFLEVVECFGAVGWPVDVVSRHGALATALRTRAKSVRFLPHHPPGLAA